MISSRAEGVRPAARRPRAARPARRRATAATSTAPLGRARARCARTGVRVERRILRQDRSLERAQRGVGSMPNCSTSASRVAGRPRAPRPAGPSGRARASAARCRRSRSGCSAASASSSPTSSRVPAERELGLDALLERGQPHLLEPLDRDLRERLVGEVGERRAAPERERLAQEIDAASRLAARERLARPRSFAARSGRGRASRARRGSGIRAAASRSRLGAERLAQLGDLSLDLRDRGDGRSAGVEVVREPVDRARPGSRAAAGSRASRAASGPPSRTGPSSPTTSSGPRIRNSSTCAGTVAHRRRQLPARSALDRASQAAAAQERPLEDQEADDRHERGDEERCEEDPERRLSLNRREPHGERLLVGIRERTSAHRSRPRPHRAVRPARSRPGAARLRRARRELPWGADRSAEDAGRIGVRHLVDGDRLRGRLDPPVVELADAYVHAHVSRAQRPFQTASRAVARMRDLRIRLRQAGELRNVSGRLSMEVPAAAAAVPGARRAITRLCEHLGLAGELTDRIRLAVTEACTNCVLHAYAATRTTATFAVEARVEKTGCCSWCATTDTE